MSKSDEKAKSKTKKSIWEVAKSFHGFDVQVKYEEVKEEVQKQVDDVVRETEAVIEITNKDVQEVAESNKKEVDKNMSASSYDAAEEKQTICRDDIEEIMKDLETVIDKVNLKTCSLNKTRH